MQKGYRAIANQIRARIQSGDLPAGSQLEGIRALATEHGVTTATAQRAVTALAQEGWLTVRPSSGTYVAEHQPTASTPDLHTLAEEVADLKRRVERLENE